eukprot:scaffold48061_cov48-Phaeocystis_antarctica.AAC.1
MLSLCASNFAGCEPLRQLFRHRFPAFWRLAAGVRPVQDRARPVPRLVAMSKGSSRAEASARPNSPLQHAPPAPDWAQGGLCLGQPRPIGRDVLAGW